MDLVISPSYSFSASKISWMVSLDGSDGILMDGFYWFDHGGWYWLVF
jgi:hypothetical protein